MPSFKSLAPGLNHVGAYQVSGAPFATGSCVAPASGTVGATMQPSVQKISFPNVTRWVKIQVSGSHDTQLRVSFSQNGMADHALGGIGGNYFLAQAGDSPVLEFKVSELYFMSNGLSNVTFDIVAGLTSIAPTGTNTDYGTSWSGSTVVG